MWDVDPRLALVIFTKIDKANENANSYSDLGYAYKHPRYAHKSRGAREFLAGAHKFQLSEIEVYQRVE